MRVLLINPPWIVHRKKNIWRNIASVMPPLGLAWMAAVLEKEGHEIEIFDAHALGYPLSETSLWLRANGKFDCVGITATTPLIFNALEIAKQVKENNIAPLVIIGGVHATVLPDEVLAEPAVDLVVRGEGEITMSEIARGLPLSEIDGISYRDQGRVIHNRVRKLLADLDTLPMPAYHLLPLEKYRPALGAALREPAISILATRGCPGRCTFCYKIFGKNLRVRSGKKIAEEIKYLQENFGIKEVCFYDDTFTSVKKEVENFCNSLKKLNIDLTWSCFSRIDTYCKETFQLMKETGCHQVMFGVESYNPEILKNINKKIDIDRVQKVIRATQDIGIEVRATFMLGNPGETKETMEKNIEYAIDLDPDIALFNITTPYPGTEMFQWADQNGYLLSRDWRDYDLSKPIMLLPTVSTDEIIKYYQLAHRRFILRPRFLYKMVKKFLVGSNLRSIYRAVRMLFGL